MNLSKSQIEILRGLKPNEIQVEPTPLSDFEENERRELAKLGLVRRGYLKRNSNEQCIRIEPSGIAYLEKLDESNKTSFIANVTENIPNFRWVEKLKNLENLEKLKP